MKLHNRVNGEELKKRIQEDPTPRKTISFYTYANIDDPQSFRDQLFIRWDKIGVLGRVYVASEGINAQISVPEPQHNHFLESLNEVDFLRGIRLNYAVDDNGKSFFKLTIKVRDKIVADGLEVDIFKVAEPARYLNVNQFNELTENPDTILIDMRNHYESEVGHFKDAWCPDVDTFRDSLPIVEDILDEHRDKHIVMYCTGGIRCEKASAWFKHRGFEKVYQLEGGIIKYAHDVEEKGLENKFKGKNFVFDERLGERISNEIISKCHQCGKPADTHTNCVNVTCNLLFIQCEECAQKYEGCCSEECQDFIHLPEEKQAELRKGMDKGVRIYTKGRLRPGIKGD